MLCKQATRGYTGCVRSAKGAQKIPAKGVAHKASIWVLRKARTHPQPEARRVHNETHSSRSFRDLQFFLWLTSPEGDEIQLLLMVSRRREELQNHASEDIDIYADCSKPSTRMWHMVAALALFVLKSTQMRR
jgi:hypothetical protein